MLSPKGPATTPANVSGASFLRAKTHYHEALTSVNILCVGFGKNYILWFDRMS